jgi:hypothetical protein
MSGVRFCGAPSHHWSGFSLWLSVVPVPAYGYSLAAPYGPCCTAICNPENADVPVRLPSWPQRGPRGPLVRCAECLRVYARRVGDGDVEALALMLGFADELDIAIAEAVKDLRAYGYSWAEIGCGSTSPARPRNNAGEHLDSEPAQGGPGYPLRGFRISRRTQSGRLRAIFLWCL